MSTVVVFNPNSHVVAIASDGRMLGGQKQAVVDPSDPIAALAIQQKFVVVVSNEEKAPTPPAPVEPEVVAEEPATEAPVEEIPAEAEPAPSSTTRKKSSTTTTSTES